MVEGIDEVSVQNLLEVLAGQVTVLVVVPTTLDGPVLKTENPRRHWRRCRTPIPVPPANVWLKCTVQIVPPTFSHTGFEVGAGGGLRVD